MRLCDQRLIREAPRRFVQRSLQGREIADIIDALARAGYPPRQN